VGLFVPKGTLMTPPEIEALIRDALRADEAAFGEQRGLSPVITGTGACGLGICCVPLEH
jgi:hypothetical protein